MKLIKKLQECSTIGQADPILTRLGAGPAVKKLVETALILSNSQDPQQRNHAYSFMESAIRELENADVDDENHPPVDKTKQGHLDHDQNEPVSPVQEEDDDDEDEEDAKLYKKMHEEEDDDKEHKIHEEELENHNNGPREDGSEQSTENREPYPGTARDSTNGEKPMQDMDNTQNQWNETGGFPQNGMIVPGLPPTSPGLAPDIAQEMGMKMPAPPPMDTNQMMRQMQYTVDNKMKAYHNKMVAPLNRVVRQQRETIKKQKQAIKELSMQIREVSTKNGNMRLDLDSMKQNAGAKFRETETPLQRFVPDTTVGYPAVQPITDNNRVKVSKARNEIEQMDKILNSHSNSMYN